MLTAMTNFGLRCEGLFDSTPGFSTGYLTAWELEGSLNRDSKVPTPLTAPRFRPQNDGNAVEDCIHTPSTLRVGADRNAEPTRFLSADIITQKS